MHGLRELKPLDAKLAAKRLHAALKDRKIEVSHGACLDLVARQFGLKDWNVMAARMTTVDPPVVGVEAPQGWTADGFNFASFAGGLDPDQKHLGHSVFWLRNVQGENGHATVYQRVLAGSYAGKRVRFSGWLRTEGVGGAASLAVGACDSQGRYINFTSLDHLRGEGPLRGTMDWSHRALVLDVPVEAHSLYYAFLLARTGEARFAGLQLETVGRDVPVTKPQELDAPENLDFGRN